MCCSSWCRKELDTTQQMTNNNTAHKSRSNVWSFKKANSVKCYGEIQDDTGLEALGCQLDNCDLSESFHSKIEADIFQELGVNRILPVKPEVKVQPGSPQDSAL